MKRITSFIISIAMAALLLSCQQKTNQPINANKAAEVTDTLNSKKQIASMLDSFNLAAASADFEKYFSYLAEDAIYIGTDATENWDKKAFMVWAKPYFDKKNAWDFSSVDRHIYMGKTGDIAWFDELLDAPFAKICRGSGVVTKLNDEWKIQQYVLSMTVPNKVGNEIVKIKASIEDSILHELKSRK